MTRQAETSHTSSACGVAVYLSFFLAALFSMVLAVPASASLTRNFQETFGSANQPSFGQAQGLAVDQESGDLLVMDVHTDEVQTVTVSASAGQFQLVFGGKSTASLSFDATAVQVQGALRALPSIGTPNVNVSGGPGNQAGSRPYIVTFTKAFAATDVEQLDCENGSTPLSGGSGCSVATSAPGVTSDNISRWHADGTPSEFSALGSNVIDAKGGPDLTPESGFGFDGLNRAQVVIDESGTATDGNIYVAQGNGNTYLDVFSSTGEYLGQLTAAGATPFGTICGVAVDAAGNIYVGDNTAGEIHKFDPAASLPLNADHVASFPLSNVCALATGAGPTAGSLFAVGLTHVFRFFKLDAGSGELKYEFPFPNFYRMPTVDPNSGHVLAGFLEYVVEFDASGPTPNQITEFAKSNSGVEGVANEGGSRVYVSRNNQPQAGLANPHIEVYGSLVHVPEPVTGAASSIANNSATLNGTINPDTVPLEECSFEWGTTTAYGNTAPCAETPAQIGSGTTPVPVHADLSSLFFATTYHYRLVAINENGTVKGANKTFRTFGPPELKGEWASEVLFEEATLNATLNPEGLATTLTLEYGTDTSYGNTASTVVPAATAEQTRSFPLEGLSPGTTYHYRFVAENVASSEAGSPTVGPDRTFTTYRTPANNSTCPNRTLRNGPAARLPDCRAFEMVSPIDKNGGDISAYFFEDFDASSEDFKGLDQSASDGAKIAYSSATAFAGALGSPFVSQYIATRSPAGWATEAINPPARGGSTRGIAGLDSQYKAFSGDLAYGYLLPESGLPLTTAPGPVEGFNNLYRRDNATGSYTWLESSAPEPEPCLPGVGECVAVLPFLYPELQGFSADGTCAVFRVNDALTEEASRGVDSGDNGRTLLQLYHWCEGQGVRLVSVLPDGSPYQGDSSAGTENVEHNLPSYTRGRTATAKYALSAAGTRVFWTTSSPPGFGPKPGRLYLRINADKPQSTISKGQCAQPTRACTLPVSEAVPTGQPARFWAASADGSRAVFSIDGSDSLAGNLYEYDLATKSTTLIAKDTRGVAGVSDDLSRVYFVSEEVLTAEEENSEGGVAQAGEPNLYLREGGALSFIGILATADLSSNGVHPEDLPSPISAMPRNDVSRASADGSHLAFVSAAPLTGYDNTDAVSGEPDREVYLYDADSGELRCASCNPSGARPKGTDLTNPNIPPVGLWTAAYIPGYQHQLYGRRPLSEDGNRLFFNSVDALVPQDVNDAQDVYQWEAPSSGDCTLQSPTYSLLNEGCVSLISSGESPQDSEFVDASASGDDIFIRTSSSLDPRDPGLVDIYDARVNGGIAIPGAPAACEGEACQSPPAQPNDPTPASSTFEGAGNVSEGSPGKPRCAKGKVRRKGRCIVRKHNRKRRGRTANDNRRAPR